MYKRECAHTRVYVCMILDTDVCIYRESTHMYV
jgi:hypothetical protein